MPNVQIHDDLSIPNSYRSSNVSFHGTTNLAEINVKPRKMESVEE